MEKLIENATIIYKNGEKLVYDAIQITKNGIYTGRIIKKNDTREVFEDQGFIPNSQIQKIMIFNEYGSVKNIEL